MKCHQSPARLVVLAICFITIFDKACCCELSWNRYEDHCYRIFTMPRSRQIAGLRCRMDGSDLVSITNVTILDFLSQHIAHSNSSTFWVGLFWNSSLDDLQWFDGSTDTQNQPWVAKVDKHHLIFGSLLRNTDFYGLGCFAYDGGTVVMTPCLERNAFICSHHISEMNIHNRCTWLNGIQDSFVGDSTGDCFFKADSTTQSNKAQQLCDQNGGHFVDLEDVMRDGLTAFYEHKVLSNDGSKYWTGFTWNGTNLFYSDGRVVPEDYPIPVINTTGSCITVEFNFTDFLSTNLYTTDCDEKANVICSIPSGGNEPPATTTETSHDHRDVMMHDDPQLICPDGYNWKSQRTSDYCYWETSFETDQLSRDLAESYCQSYGGHLVSFHSVEEEKIGLSFQYGSLAQPYWIGLSLDLNTENYTWSDGSPLDYQNWAPGHPDHKDKSLRCVAMEAHAKHWVSSLCGILSWFVCKVPKKTYHHVPYLPTPPPLESCENHPVLRHSSYLFQGACYFTVSNSFSWHRAKQYCEDQGSTLASIHSPDELGFLLRLFHESSMETNRAWIGLNSFGSDGNFRWTDWTAVDFTFFSDDEPNNFQNQEKCCNMYTRTGQWNDENCNAALDFVCKRIRDPTVTTVIPSTQDPRIGNCKQGWISHVDRCYYLGGKREKQRVNWTEAQDICQKQGGYLASIRDDIDQNFLSYLLQTLGVDAWIGLHDTIQSGRYYWLDNSDVRYTNWAPGEPSFFGIMEDCVKMVYDHLHSGVWKDDECQREMGYICQNMKDPKLPSPPSDRGMNCIQPEGWLKLDTMCFKMFDGNTLTWEKAEMACQEDGGHLVSVSDQKVMAVVKHLATEVNQPFFIGLKYNEDAQTLRWLNDFPFTVSNWEKHEPSLLTEDTCFASTSEGYWKKYSCDEKMPYACQITTGEPAKRNQYTGECPPSSKAWVPGSNSFCYILDSSFRSDWFTANLMCFRYSSHLISIHSKEDLENLKKLMKPGMRSVFLGLMTNKKDGFTWTDESPVDFVNWDEMEPSGSADQCVEMMVDSMKWRLTSCIGKKHFVCQDRKVTLLEENPQTAEFAAEQNGLSTAAICAVVLTILVGVVLIMAAALYRWRTSNRAQFRRHVREHSISFENALYNVGNSSMEFHDEENKSSS